MNVSSGNFLLDREATVIFDSNGEGRTFLAPDGARETWQVAFISVNSTSTLSIPTVQFYRGSIVPSNFVTGTFSGTLDVDSQPGVVLRSGQRLYALWTGGDVGATGTFILTGTRVVI